MAGREVARPRTGEVSGRKPGRLLILVSDMIFKQGQASWKSNIPSGRRHANELRANVVGLRGALVLGETTTHDDDFKECR